MYSENMLVRSTVLLNDGSNNVRLKKWTSHMRYFFDASKPEKDEGMYFKVCNMTRENRCKAGIYL